MSFKVGFSEDGRMLPPGVSSARGVDWSRGYSRDDFVSLSGGLGRTDRVRVWAWPGALLRSFVIFAGGEFGYATTPPRIVTRVRVLLRQQAGRMQEHVRR